MTSKRRQQRTRISGIFGLRSDGGGRGVLFLALVTADRVRIRETSGIRALMTTPRRSRIDSQSVSGLEFSFRKNYLRLNENVITRAAACVVKNIEAFQMSKVDLGSDGPRDEFRFRQGQGPRDAHPAGADRHHRLTALAKPRRRLTLVGQKRLV